MVTKEQAMTCKQFRQIAAYTDKTAIITPVNWRANGKCKTWKRSPEKFSLPIKHGLYSYGYITNENAHLFEITP